MLRLLQKNLQLGKRHIVHLMHCRCIIGGGSSGDHDDGDFNQTSFLTGGLDKFQGGVKEESYFLNKNNKLIIKMRDRERENPEILKEQQQHQEGRELTQNNKDIQQQQPQHLDKQPKDLHDKEEQSWKEIPLNLSYMEHDSTIFAPCKHKNYQEEAYFFNEQVECTKRYCHNQVDKVDVLEKNPDEIDE